MNPFPMANAPDSTPANKAGLVLCGTHTIVGTTTILAALAQALRDRGASVQTFNVGSGLPVQQLTHFSPGPLSLGATAAVLDAWLLSREQNLASFHRLSAAASISLVEGCLEAAPPTKAKGSRRSSSSGGSSSCSRSSAGQGSALQLAHWLGLPVVLVVDAQRHASVDSILQLLEAEHAAAGPEQRLEPAGIVLNHVHSAAFVDEVTAGLKMAGVAAAVLGGITELDNPSAYAMAQQLQQSVDMEQLLQVAASAQVPPLAVPIPPAVRPYRVQIGVAWDEAYGCYFQDNLELLGAAGAELVPFSPLHDVLLPPGLSALYLGGSAPEPALVKRLSANAAMLAAVRAFAAAGGLVLAEGGGLAYLSQALQLPGEGGAGYTMAGVLCFRVRLLPPEAHRQGYAEVTVGHKCALLPAGASIRGRYNSSCVVLEEREVEGLGSSWASGATQRGSTTRTSSSSMRSSGSSATSDASSNSSGGTSSTLVVAYQAQTASALAAGSPPVPEGYCLGGALGSFVHLHFGSCPAAAPHMVQRCGRVDVATVTSAAADATRKALEAVRAAQAAEAERLAASLAARRAKWTAADGWSADSSPIHTPADSPLPLKVPQRCTQLPSATRSVPDLVAFEQRQFDKGMAAPSPSPYGSPRSGFHTPQRYWQGYNAGLPSPEQRYASGYQRHRQQEGQQQQGQQGRFGLASKSMSTSDIQQLAAAVDGADNGGKPPAFAVPKRWTLELQRSLTSLFQSASTTGSSPAVPPPQHPHHRRTTSAGGKGSKGNVLALPHCRSPVGGACSCGNPSCGMHDARLLPLDGKAAKLLDGTLRPGGGKAHQKLIGLAVPLVGGQGPGKPPAVPGAAAAAAGRHVAWDNSSTGSAALRPAHSASALAGMSTPERACRSLDLLGRPIEQQQHMVHSASAAALGRTVSGPALQQQQQQQQWQPSRPNDRIMSLSPAATDCIIAMGLLPRLAGITDACDMPPVAAPGPSSCAVVCRSRLPPAPAAFPSAGAAAAAAAARVIAARAAGERTHDVDERLLQRQKPALVIVPGGSEDDAGVLERRSAQRALERAGVLWPESGTAVLYQSCHTLSEVLEFMLVLGQAAEAPEAAAQLVERLRDRLRAVAVAGAAAAEANNGRRPRVAVLDGVSPLTLAGRWVPEMVSLAGGVPVGGAVAGAQSVMVEWQALRQMAPDVIVLTRRALTAEAAALDSAELAALPGWWSLPAVRSGRVYAFDQALLQRPGPRLVDGVEALAAALQLGQQGVPVPQRGVLKLMLHGGQRCRPKLLPNYFAQP